MNDLISRKAALELIRALPPAQPEITLGLISRKTTFELISALPPAAKEGMWRELAASYERTIVKLTEAIAAQAQNAGAKMDKKVSE